MTEDRYFYIVEYDRARDEFLVKERLEGRPGFVLLGRYDSREEAVHEALRLTIFEEWRRRIRQS
jgi:hypothetical protein